MCLKFIDLCVENEEKEIIKLITIDSSLIYYKDNYGRTGLMYAAEYGYDNLIKLLAAPEIIDQVDVDGNTPLTFAMLGDLPGHANVVKILLSLGATKVNEEYFPVKSNYL